MTTSSPRELPPLDRTLTRVVLLMRLLGWVWLVVLVIVAATNESSVSGSALIGTLVVATLGTGLTFMASFRGFLGSTWYWPVDGLIALVLALAGWIGGSAEFLVGGYPVSWLFIVAYATNMTVSVLAGVAASAAFAALHVLMDLDATRIFGSIQFVIVALVVSWAFDALRSREGLRLRAEAERTRAEVELSAEQQMSARLRERSSIARRLHDSVLQTLKLISTSADDPEEVRYLARVQERDLRRTINEYQSAHEDSFRARLLDAAAVIEDRYRVQIEHVINNDAETDDAMRALIEAATEAMNNAARHSGARTIDLFSEIHSGVVEVSIRDRGKGFTELSANRGISHSIVQRMTAVGGEADIESSPQRGTLVTLRLPVK